MVAEGKPKEKETSRKPTIGNIIERNFANDTGQKNIIALSAIRGNLWKNEIR